MKKYSVLSLLFLCVSCQYIDKQIPNEEELLNKEIEAMDWKKVDDFPALASCDSVKDKLQSQQCFISTLTQLIQDKLNVASASIENPKSDTINVQVTIFPNSTLQFETQKETILPENAFKLDSILKARMVDFPEIKPAIKRGIPVKTQFTLPVVLKAN